jgi:hypothetical protein
MYGFCFGWVRGSGYSTLATNFYILVDFLISSSQSTVLSRFCSKFCAESEFEHQFLSSARFECNGDMYQNENSKVSQKRTVWEIFEGRETQKSQKYSRESREKKDLNTLNKKKPKKGVHVTQRSTLSQVDRPPPSTRVQHKHATSVQLERIHLCQSMHIFHSFRFRFDLGWCARWAKTFVEIAAKEARQTLGMITFPCLVGTVAKHLIGVRTFTAWLQRATQFGVLVSISLQAGLSGNLLESGI